MANFRSFRSFVMRNACNAPGTAGSVGILSLWEKSRNRSPIDVVEDWPFTLAAKLPIPSHRIQKDWKAKLKAAVPFGLGQVKPKHFRDMAAVVWKNRDNLPYAWKVLSRGVCDGCALGVAGFHDWTIPGIHLCMTRLNLLRLNTMPELDVRLLEDVEELHRRLALARRSPNRR